MSVEKALEGVSSSLSPKQTVRMKVLRSEVNSGGSMACYRDARARYRIGTRIAPAARQ